MFPLPFQEKNHFPKTSEIKKIFWRLGKVLLFKSTQQAPLPKQAKVLTKEKIMVKASVSDWKEAFK